MSRSARENSPPSTPDNGPEPWSADDFQAIASMLHARQGSTLPPQRLGLIQARLQARLQARGIPSFTWFHERVLRPRPDGPDMQMLIDLSTVNHTAFFREEKALRFLAERLAERLRPGVARSGPVRVWSAGCSAGQEPYSLAILLMERVPLLAPDQLQIWATDLSLEMIHHGARAIYDAKSLADVPANRLRRFFLRGRGRRYGVYRIVPEVRRLVAFQQFDLRSATWPASGEFDAILCRNVAIYFNESERVRLLDRLTGRLREGGWLVVGHCEILPERPACLEKLAPSIFRKGKRP